MDLENMEVENIHLRTSIEGMSNSARQWTLFGQENLLIATEINQLNNHSASALIASGKKGLRVTPAVSLCLVAAFLLYGAAEGQLSRGAQSHQLHLWCSPAFLHSKDK